MNWRATYAFPVKVGGSCALCRRCALERQSLSCPSAGRYGDDMCLEGKKLMPFDDQRAIASPTGAKINLYIRRAIGKARGVIQVNHGLAEHAARYARFAD